MELQAFRNDDGIYGFTKDRTGANLPNQSTNWKFFRSISAQKGQPLIALNTDALLKGIEEDGFYLTRVSMSFSVSEG